MDHSENSCAKKTDKILPKLYCHDVTNNNLFPQDSEGCLDRKVLKKLGFISQVMATNEFLFFYQLTLSICDKVNSGGKSDARLSYYSKVEEWYNLYTDQIGLRGGYGLEFKNSLHDRNT